LNEIREIGNAVRDLVNDGYYWRYESRNEQYIWSKICSCMDWIEETEYMIGEYQGQKDYQQHGQAMIYIVGLLQALLIQQDIVTNLKSCVGIENAKDRPYEINKIRDLRNIFAGHPTETTSGSNQIKAYRYTSPSRDQEYGEARYALWHDKRKEQYDPERNPDDPIKVVDLIDQISKNRSWLEKQLGEIYDHMEREENKWRAKMRNGFKLIDNILSPLKRRTRFFVDDYSSWSYEAHSADILELERELKKLKIEIELTDIYRKALNFYKDNKELDDCQELFGYIFRKLDRDIEKEALEIKKGISTDLSKELILSSL